MLLFRVKVEGESLWPELIPGRIYWASGLPRTRVGDYVVFKDPENPSRNIVKKVKEMRNGTLSVEGTIKRSASYEITSENVIGRLLFRPH